MTIKINAQIDVLPLVNQTIQAQRNLAFSVVQGINNTAKRIQQEERAKLEQNFTLRSKTKPFMLRNAAIIKPFASVTQGRPYAEVSVGQKQRLLLGGFEKGLDRAGGFVGHNIAMPVAGSPARPAFRSSVPEAYRYNKLRMKKVGGRYVGQHDTYVIPNVGVFMRQGKGKQNSQLLYGFHPTQHLKAKMHFVDTAQQVASKWMSEEIHAAFIKKMR